MAEGADYSENFYAGADYGLDPNYAAEFSTGVSPDYRFPTSRFGITTDPRTANQLKAVSDKLNTGAKHIEITGVTAGTWENVPEQHLTEIKRLKQLAGIDLTFHGPTIEPTGVTKQGWNESHREQAERQMSQAVERAHKMDPSGNIVVTFHSSNGLPDPETKVMEEDPKTGKMREVIKEFGTVSHDGRFDFKKVTPDYFRGKGGEYESLEEQKNAIGAAIDKQNKDAWFRQLQHLSFNANSGASIISDALTGRELDPDLKKKTDEGQWLQIYSKYMKEKNMSKVIKKIGEPWKGIVEKQLHRISHGDIYLRDAYQDLQTLYNQAYENAEKDGNDEDLEKLKRYRDEMRVSVEDIQDPKKIDYFAEEIVKGVNVLRSIEAPRAIKPLREFAVDKSSETFSNIAFNAYKKFKDNAPIVSVENPPAGMGLAQAEDLRDVVGESRKKLQKKLMEQERLSEDAAKKQAEKLIGVTWDVGHINMIRKYGYSEDQLEEQTKEIAPYVKHVHLSDNFGMEHTELPMGMGNVPTKRMMKMLKQYGKQFDKIKQVIETGTWFGPQAFGNRTPFAESLSSFGSPIYSMKMAPYWNQASDASGGYFVGYG
ncbi:MAG: TIM barrel protein, partial [Nanoarchaeota archaeon]